ncbi:single-stranded DNA-binding protein [Nanchangia anserum]|uniref:Single-stranded DNA-binding protein n=1 Tax=Nanchangia anserum TaxID=2692125 RepID=A0A8I0GBJ5_9ACTO|nr:single-stranded DNA-binding protein [Nanchangia anserum]MBD3689758.1 single-stranded DNA-binding protein [Nanchangia anserum]QOX81929.1 single-stranded DNA-binding protein [Nanchangia anserum]
MSRVHITVSGIIAKAPQLHTADATTYTYAHLSARDSTRDEQGNWVNGPTTYYSIKVRGKAAANLVDTVTACGPIPVIVAGTLKTRQWVDEDGNKRISRTIYADHIGASFNVPLTVFAPAKTGEPPFDGDYEFTVDDDDEF